MTTTEPQVANAIDAIAHMPPATDNTATIDLFTPEQACNHLGVQPEFLLRLINQGVLPAYNLGGVIRFRRCAVAALCPGTTIAA